MDKKAVQQIQQFLAPFFGVKPSRIEVGEDFAKVSALEVAPEPSPTRPTSRTRAVRE